MRTIDWYVLDRDNISNAYIKYSGHHCGTGHITFFNKTFYFIKSFLLPRVQLIKSGEQIIAKVRRGEYNVVHGFHAIPGIHGVAHSSEHCGVAPDLPIDQNQNFPIFATAKIPSSFLCFKEIKMLIAIPVNRF